ncbi:MAG: BPSS1780 family membrane protein [Rhodocyclaceae bacterium]|nr:BPSS1780 family membrane protein [Rhodocyclaceae bacterium]
MQARRLPAVRGAFWLFEGFRLFRRNPPLITSLTLVYLLVVQLLAVLLPGIGPILLPLLLPVMTLIVANGCRLVDLGKKPDKATLLHGVAGNFPAMLQLGGLQLLGAMLVILLSMALNGGTDPFVAGGALPAAPNMGEGSAAPGTDTAANAAAQVAMLNTLLQVLLLATPLIIAFWFAPFLVGWDRVSPLKSVFFSTVASLRNWRAMFMFSLAGIVLAGIIPGFLLIVVSQISGMALGPALVALRMILIFFVAPVLTASIYISYRDIFQPSVDTNV